MPVPPALRLIRKIGTSPAWKRATGVSRSLVWPVSLTNGICSAVSACSISSSISTNCENTMMLRPDSTMLASMSISSSNFALATAAPAPRLQQPRVAADLPQLEQRFQDGDVAAGEAALLDLVADALVHRQPDALVEVALALAEIDLADHLLLGRQLARRPAPWSGAAGTAAPGRPAVAGGRCRPPSRSGCGTPAGRSRDRRGSPASGNGRPTRARPGDSPWACPTALSGARP